MLITIVDDEKVLSEKISKKLKLNWYSVNVYNSYNEFLLQANSLEITDLFILDLSLWDWSWFDIIKHLRNTKNIKAPIIIISWYWDTQNIIFWLDLWADDYITKPILPDVLLARVRAILRRPTDIKEQWILIYKNLVLHLEKKELYYNKVLVDLKPKEFLIIEFLIKNKWKLIEKSQLISYVRWEKQDVTDNTINVTMANVRKKFWDDFSFSTVKWFGYFLD